MRETDIAMGQTMSGIHKDDILILLSANVGVMNLLPIPALDGGRLVCLLVTAGAEKILRRKIDPKYEGYLNGFFMILLMALMVLITFKDVWQIFDR